MPHWLRKLLKNKHLLRNFTFLCAGIFLTFGSVAALWVSSLEIPDLSALENRKVSNSTKIYDRTGEVLLFDIHRDVRRTNIPFEDMGANIKNATVAIEDSEFYSHKGVRITSIVRAVLSNFIYPNRNTQGGSTITQQLVKNALLAKDSGFGRYVRKVKEWVLAIKLEQSLPKEKILEAYLNEIPYGGTIYGIEEAARSYFNKKSYDLTIAESAYLAAIPQSPSLLSPYGKHQDRLESRKNLVLSQMKDLNFITAEEFEAAKNEKVVFATQESGTIKAPHFVFFIKEYLEQKYGADMAENGGLKVTTTLDYALQEKAESIVKDGALQNEKDWDGENAGLVAIDPKTGQILTMVGSRDYFDKEIDGNYNIATAERQPGSSFKPFIYATAFNKGYTPNTVLFDLPTEFSTTCDPYGKALPGRSQSNCYMPENYDGKSRGPMSLRAALAESINVVAVKLFYLAGLRDSLRVAEEMGISTLADVGRYGLTLVIGGGEVSLLDMTSAYGVFANNGIRNPYSGILKIEDMQGRVMEEFTEKPREVLPKNTALLISDILSDNQARIPTFGANSSLRIPGYEVAAKTGTTNNNRDAWTVGYTPSLVVGVWAGNNDNHPMKKGGVAMAGPIWNKFVTEALKGLPNEQFEEPVVETDPTRLKPVLRGVWQGNDNFFIDSVSGKLATEYTPSETLQERVITNVHSILYWVDKNNPLGPPPDRPEDDPQYTHWEIPIQNWWRQNSGKYQQVSANQKPNSEDDVHTEFYRSQVSILEPNSSTNYLPEDKIYLKISSTGKFPLQKIEVFVNDVYLGNSTPPFNFSFIPADLENLKETNELKIISYDSAYNRSETVSIFKVE